MTTQGLATPEQRAAHLEAKLEQYIRLAETQADELHRLCAERDAAREKLTGLQEQWKEMVVLQAERDAARAEAKLLRAQLDEAAVNLMRDRDRINALMAELDTVPREDIVFARGFKQGRDEEREACAKVAEGMERWVGTHEEFSDAGAYESDTSIATAIRNRSTQGGTT